MFPLSIIFSLLSSPFKQEFLVLLPLSQERSVKGQKLLLPGKKKTKHFLVLVFKRLSPRAKIEFGLSKENDFLKMGKEGSFTD